MKYQVAPSCTQQLYAANYALFGYRVLPDSICLIQVS